jgi:hypothetical protein
MTFVNNIRKIKKKIKQKLRDKESSTLEKFEEKLKPQRLYLKVLFRKGEN